MQTKETKIKRFYLMALLVFLSFMLVTISLGQRTTAAAAEPTDTVGATIYTYLPLIRYQPVPPIPQFVKNVATPSAQCPNSVGFNAVSGYVYVANNFSYNVSAFKDGNFVSYIAMGKWPTVVAADNDSGLTYVTGLHDGVTVIDGLTVVGKIPKNYEPYGVAVNPVNGNTYVTDLDSTVQVANGTSLIANVSVTDPAITPPNNGAGWLQPIVVDPNTGLVYVASWSHGKMYVLNGTNIVANYRAGWGVKEMAIDADRGYIYLAHSEPNATYPHNISVFNINTQAFTFIDIDPGNISGSRSVAVDPISGNAYFSNPDKNTVTIVNGTQVIKTMAVGTMPWGMGVNPNTGDVFVANRGSNTISVIRGLDVVNTIASQGLQPFAVGVDTINNDVYIANRGDEYGLFLCRQASVTILH